MNNFLRALGLDIFSARTEKVTFEQITENLCYKEQSTIKKKMENKQTKKACKTCQKSNHMKRDKIIKYAIFFYFFFQAAPWWCF